MCTACRRASRGRQAHPWAFIPHLWLTGRRRAAVTAGAVFGGCTAAKGLVAPDHSLTFWRSGLSAPDFVDLAQADNQSVHGFLARMELDGAAGTAGLLVVVATTEWVGYRRGRQAYVAGELLAGAVIVGAMDMVLSPNSWSHHQTTLAVAAACTVRSTSGLVPCWLAGVYALMSLPYQSVLPVVWPEVTSLSDNLGLLLALVIIGAVTAAPPSPRRQSHPSRLSQR